LAGISNWIDANHLKDSTYVERYVASFYFSTVTMISVGYGDIVPINLTERIVVILFMFCSTMQLSYTVSTIWTITAQINEKKEE
jgi:potassium voltage-gated channel Eag-related subfamily H protein 5